MITPEFLFYVAHLNTTRGKTTQVHPNSCGHKHLRCYRHPYESQMVIDTLSIFVLYAKPGHLVFRPES